MCYNAASLTQASLKYARHRGEDPEEIARIEEQLEQERQLLMPFYRVNAFAHPPLLVFTNEAPKHPRFFQWGLIPHWVRDEQQAAEIANQTLNARCETMFEKPAFKRSAVNKRCLIYLDAFFEFHHLKGNTYPFLVRMKDQHPMILAGLWDTWTNKQTGELHETVTIVTTVGNEPMSRIHNNPKASGPRMPVILSAANQDKWLQPIHNEADKQAIEELTQPFPGELLEFHSVGKILGKDATPNDASAWEPKIYPELQGLI